jgi:hypothetical protein
MGCQAASTETKHGATSAGAIHDNACVPASATRTGCRRWVAAAVHASGMMNPSCHAL